MKYLGFPKNAIAWFKSYRSKRKFTTNINTTYSHPSNQICDVLKRTIPEPLLFLIYINDLPQVVDCESFVILC